MKANPSTVRICVLLLMLSLLLSAGCRAGMSESSISADSPAVSEAPVVTDTPADAEAPEQSALADGIYSAAFVTDSSMFRVNEAHDGKGTLTVKDGKMTLHISLPSKSIRNLFIGSAEDAQKDGAVLLIPTVDTVTYSDGMTEEVHGFDIPVPALDEDFAVALVGTKGTWYDHTVSVTDAVPDQ